MPMKKIFILFILLMASANSLTAQTKVSGVVVDNTNQPVPYANIVFKGSNTGVVSNEDGRFYIESPDTFTALIVSFVGFPDTEVTWLRTYIPMVRFCTIVMVVPLN